MKMLLRGWIRENKISITFVVVLAALAAALLRGGIPLYEAYRPSQDQGKGQNVTQTPPPAGKWQEVERLVSEQKFEAALQEVEKIRGAAQKAGDTDEWTRALIKEVQLRIGLHGFETAVRFLKDQPWPDSSLNRAALSLFYARSLVTYYQ